MFTVLLGFLPEDSRRNIAAEFVLTYNWYFTVTCTRHYGKHLLDWLCCKRQSCVS